MSRAKPSGDIYLYGIENQRLGNIHFDRVDWQRLVDHVRKHRYPEHFTRNP